MASGNTVSLDGNLTSDPTLRFTPTGTPVCNLGIAWNNRYQQNNEWVEKVSYFDVVAYNALAENAAESLTKGMRVSVHGRLNQNTWETPEGDKRSRVEIVADEIGPSLRWATVGEVTRNEKTERPERQPARSGGGRSSTVRAPQPPTYDYGDEEPF